jgi:predicted alpha/beta superfamily hydrolase
MYDPDPDFEIIPETIIAGIYQNYSMDETTYNLIRGKDAMWNKDTGMFSKNSKLFNGFITEELLPYLKSNYKIGEFSAILGGSLTAS